MLDELTDIEKARLIIMQARRQEIPDWQLVVKPQAAPTPPLASLGRTKSQRRFKGWIMALVVLGMLGCCGVMGWCVWVVVR